MPYITLSAKTRLYPEGIGESANDAGELNYLITRIIDDYLGDAQSYRRFNEVIGVLECAKLEYYRRKVAPYEDKKIQENGDVF